MNVFNRVMMILLILALLVAVTAVCLFPDYFILQATWLADQLEQAGRALTVTWRVILIGIAVVVDLILLLILVLELRRARPKAVRVQEVEGGQAVVTVDSIQNRLAFYIDSLAEVVSARPRVEIKGDRVRVAVDVKTAAAVSVPAKAREVVEVIRMVITETMGLKLLGEPKVNIRTASYADAAVPPARPVAEPVPPPVFAGIEAQPPESTWPEELPADEPPAEERPAEEPPAEVPAAEAPAEETAPGEEE
jgi:hypothetical protein